MENAGSVVKRERVVRGSVGHAVVRVDEDARRAHQRAAPEARRRLERAAVPAHDPRCRLPLRLGRRAVSLRLRMLAAFAYGFLLILVALEVPLALNLASRVDAEVRNDAAGQAHIVAAQASGLDGPRPRSSGRSPRARHRDLGARVIVVDAERVAAGRLRGQRDALVRNEAGDPHGARRAHRAGRAPQRHARRGPPVQRGAGHEPRAGSSAPFG